MDNPFTYSKIVTGDAFCNRTNEIKELSGFINSSQNVLVYSHRRLGKTCLLHRVLSQLGRKCSGMYVDLYGTTTEQDFIDAVFKSYTQIEPKIDKIIKFLNKTMKSARIDLSYNPGSDSYSLKPLFDHKENDLVLHELFETLKLYSESKKLVVVFDEFQEIENYSDGTFEKKLRKELQWHNNISYIFSGSKRHVLQQMFTSGKRAFYKQAQSFPIEKIDTVHYLTWAGKLFKKAGFNVPETVLQEVIQLCENHPMYVQKFLHHLWEFMQVKGAVKLENLPEITDTIIRLQEDEYVLLWGSLTANQKKTVKLIINTGGKDMFSAKNLAQVGLKTTSQINYSIKVLKDLDIVFKNHTWHLEDVMFKKWISTL